MALPVRFVVPIRTSTGLNAREHWAVRKKRVSAERAATRLLWRAARQRPVLPVDIQLVRIAPGTRPMDDDNLPGSMKAIRDELAELLGVDDGNRAVIRFTYAQERGPWGVRVTVRERAP